MEKGFYLLKDLNLVGKMDNFIPYIYNHSKGDWIVDNDNILMDRLIGYDEGDRQIGNTDMLLKLEEISEEEAMNIIKEA